MSQVIEVEVFWRPRPGTELRREQPDECEYRL